MQLIRIIKKFGQILSRHQKFRIIELCLLMIVGGFLEMCSVSLILPFMEAVLDPDKVMSNKYVIIVCETLGIEYYRTFLVFIALLLAVIYVVKNVFLLFQYNIQNRFVFNNQFTVQCQLLNNYISRPYEYFLGIDSGEVLRVITSDTGTTFSLLTNILMFFTEMIVSIILIVTIFVVSPEITVAIAIMLMTLVLLIMGVLRPLMRSATIRMQKASAGMNKWLLQSIQGIKELKITQKEGFFEKEYNKNGQTYVQMNRRNATYALIPRFMIEAVSMSTFLVVIAVMIYKGTDLETVIPILSLVAMAAIRLLPSVNRISGCMGIMAQGEPYLDKMIENLQEVKVYTAQEELATKTGVIGRLTTNFGLSNVRYKYPSGEYDVLNKASMTIKKGESIGIVGASGAGKTTVVDILLGLLRPQHGQVIVDGVDIRFDKKNWLNQIGYIPQTIFILDGSIRDNVAFGVPHEEVDEEAVWNALHEAALYEFVENLSDGLDTQLGERGVRLSGGQRQRIGIARALYFDPSLLFFDEATSALDNETEAAIMDSINSLHGSKTMVIIAHRLSTIESCDHVFRIENGQIKRER